jgi:hypothetical protein
MEHEGHNYSVIISKIERWIKWERHVTYMGTLDLHNNMSINLKAREHMGHLGGGEQY